MDIETYKHIYNGLVALNKKTKPNYNNTVLDSPPFFGESEKISFPITIFEEIRNTSTGYNSCYERVASVGYRVDILAQDKGKYSKLDIARELAQMVDSYLCAIGLSRVSYNSDLLMQGTTYHIVMTYTGNLLENRRKFI